AALALRMLRRGVPPPRVFAWTLAAFAVCMGNTGIRAQSFAYPCLALTLWLILADGRAPRPRARTWLLIPVLVLWANTHGSVLLGAALVALYAGYRAARARARRGGGAGAAGAGPPGRLVLARPGGRGLRRGGLPSLRDRGAGVLPPLRRQPRSGRQCRGMGPAQPAEPVQLGLLRAAGGGGHRGR